MLSQAKAVRAFFLALVLLVVGLQWKENTMGVAIASRHEHHQHHLVHQLGKSRAAAFVGAFLLDLEPGGGLNHYLEPLARLGVASFRDLALLTAEDLTAAGVTEIHKRRILAAAKVAPLRATSMVGSVRRALI